MDNPLFRVSAAVLLVALAALLVSVPVDAGGTVTNCANDTDFSNQLSGGGTVTFNCGTATIVLSSTKTITSDTTIDGGGAITLSGNNALRLFIVNNGVSLTIKNLTLENASGTGNLDGGAIRSLGSLIVSSSTFTGNMNPPGFSGGGIYSSGSLHVTNSQFNNNEAGSAGAIWQQGSAATISNTTFNQNKATNTGSYGFGGGVLLSDNATGTITSATFNQNTARQGGAIHVRSGAQLTISDSTLSGNSSTSGGGGIYNNSTLVQTNVALSGNSGATGGGIENHDTATLTGGSLTSNSALFGGGGIYNDTAGTSAMLNNVLVSSNTVSNNFSSPVYGGGIENYANLTLTDSTLTGNSASSAGSLSFGGGLYNNDYTLSTVTITGSTISGNSASNGGGILNVAAVTVINSTIDGNTAQTAGGFENYQGSATLTNVTMSANVGTSIGGAVYESGTSAGQTVTLLNSIIANSAAGANCYVAPGAATILSSGYNLSSDGTCSPYLSQGTDLNGGSPSLGPLANNGGPTLTRMPQSLSDAIDKIPMGTNGCGGTLTTDQRGYPRPFGSACDIGSVEAGASLAGTPTPTSTPSPTPTIASSPTASSTPTPTPTSSPTPTTTHGGSQTPSPTGHTYRQGDLNCDGRIDGRDALRPLRAAAGLPMAPVNGCPNLDAGSPKFGDVNCDGQIDAGDSVAILEHASGVPILPVQHEGCTPIGSALS